MDKNKKNYGPYQQNLSWLSWAQSSHFDNFEKTIESYDFLIDYSKVFNHYPARTRQPNPFSNKVMFIIDTLNSIGVKYSLDIFAYDGHKLFWSTDEDEHKLVNIIVEPNPNATGPAILFCAHHDVYNVRSENCQDNGASVCNLLRLAALISDAQESSQRTIILFSDCEENGAKGAKRFAKNSSKIENSKNIKHKIYGEISGVVNLELTGLGGQIWTDCKNNKNDMELHTLLEQARGEKIEKLSTPPSDVIAFRDSDFPALCIGILPKEDFKEKTTWRLCHSLADTLNKCNRKDMEDFTTFLFNLTKNQHNTQTEHDSDTGANQTTGIMQT